MTKRRLSAELCYLLGVVILSLGTAMMEFADFGVSMVVAPAYILHLRISEFLPFFSFGMAEYTLQAFLIIMLIIVLRQFRLGYVFAFGTAVFYGVVLDLFIRLISFVPETIVLRLIFYVVGFVFSSTGVAFLFHTYMPPEAYELCVLEISLKFRFNITKVKTIYDCSSCVVAIIMSFIFFGFLHFEGVKIGTVVCALLNGLLIGTISKLLEKNFEFYVKIPKMRDFLKKSL